MLNSQCSILIRKEARPHVFKRIRMSIEHWELSIGQISSVRLPHTFCELVFAQAFSGGPTVI
jgi:hypothetical protein